MIHFLFAFISVTFVSAPLWSQTTSSRISTIDRLAAILDSAMARDTDHILIFADTTDYTSDSIPHWIQFPNHEALDTDYHEVCGQANYYKAKDTTVEIFFFDDSPSRDWAYNISAYYRADGSLAKVDADLRTFYGNVSAETIRYYDDSGKILKQTKTFRDIHTNKRLRNKHPDYTDEPLEIFHRIKDLPFYRLLPH